MTNVPYFFSNKRYRALVTGGSRGIGLEIVQVLERLGVSVWAPKRSELDLLSSASVEAFASKIKQNSNAHSAELPISILINNAGINYLNAIESIRDQDLSDMWKTNCEGALKLTQAVATGMRAEGWGRIVNVGSILGSVSRANRAAYSMTKSALHSLTQASAIELSGAGILVNTVCPGYVDTELTRKNNSQETLKKITDSLPIGRLAKPIEIAQCVAFLCSEQNTYLTGQSIAVDGGFLCQ